MVWCRRERVAHGYCQRRSGHGKGTDGQRGKLERTMLRELHEHRRSKGIQIRFARPRMGEPVS